jgi:hypothetical protein
MDKGVTECDAFRDDRWGSEAFQTILLRAVDSEIPSLDVLEMGSHTQKLETKTLVSLETL